MPQAIDWEAEIEEIRTKATAAARHSERTVGGVSQMLSSLTSQTKALSEVNNRQKELDNRLGSLEETQNNLNILLRGRQAQSASNYPAPLLSGFIGLVLGVVASGVFFLS
ncbi:hypothetical protein [uncultured Shimia sp.]|uniref:hypothetical protein n=1 Tax=uncultured Shimia sp. TaxID=573152 RepID=UPI0025D601FC|nr:hypothetical protein [uncultured Shimia sp.]